MVQRALDNADKAEDKLLKYQADRFSVVPMTDWNE